MEKLREKIWKGSRVMAIDAVGMVGGVAVLWHPSLVDLKERRAIQFSLMAKFHFLETGVKVTLVNVYGPSTFPKIHAFLDILSWIQGQTVDGNWVIGRDFNLIANLRETKGVRRA